MKRRIRSMSHCMQLQLLRSRRLGHHRFRNLQCGLLWQRRLVSAVRKAVQVLVMAFCMVFGLDSVMNFRQRYGAGALITLSIKASCRMGSGTFKMISSKRASWANLTPSGLGKRCPIRCAQHAKLQIHFEITEAYSQQE